MSTWDKLVSYWKENIAQNIKKISAMMGSMITTLLATLIFITKEGYAWQDAGIILLLAMQPFFYLYINIVFKGETELKDHEILVLTQKLEYTRELNEYRVLLAAKERNVPEVIISAHDWNEINRKIEELQKGLGVKT